MTRNAIAALLLLSACASAPRASFDAVRPGNPVYSGTVSVDPARRQLNASWAIDFVPDAETSDSVRLLLNAGLKVTRVGGPAIARYTERDTSGYNNITLYFKPDVVAGAPVRIHIAYAGVPRFSEDRINGIDSSWVELGLDAAWHPVFARYDQYITGTVRFMLPSGWQAVASGDFARDGNVLTLRNKIPLIDIAFAAAPAIRHVSAPSSTVHYVNADSTSMRRVLATTAACANYLNALYGTRDALPHVKILMAPRNGPGYARTNYIVITDISKMSEDALSRFLCHELAHFWSSGAIASGPENWLNEAFAEYVALRYVRAHHGEEVYQKIVTQLRTVSEKQPPVWTPTGTGRPSGIVAYRKAPYLLHQLEERVGVTAMNRILARRMNERVKQTPAFLRIIREVAGEEKASWFEQQLGR